MIPRGRIWFEICCYLNGIVGGGASAIVVLRGFFSDGKCVLVYKGGGLFLLEGVQDVCVRVLGWVSV